MVIMVVHVHHVVVLMVIANHLTGQHAQKPAVRLRNLFLTEVHKAVHRAVQMAEEEVAVVVVAAVREDLNFLLHIHS